MSQTTSSRLRGLSFSAAALRAKPDLAAQLAVIVNEWSIVEGMACQILAMLLPGSDHPELFGSRVDAATAMLRRVHNFSRMHPVRTAGWLVDARHAL